MTRAIFAEGKKTISIPVFYTCQLTCWRFFKFIETFPDREKAIDFYQVSSAPPYHIFVGRDAGGESIPDSSEKHIVYILAPHLLLLSAIISNNSENSFKTNYDVQGFKSPV